MDYETLQTEVRKIEPLTLTFEKPTYGYWDYGAKSGGQFDFSLRGHNNSYHIEVGAWELNYYFTMNVPKQLSRIRGIAKRMLQRKTKIPCKIT